MWSWLYWIYLINAVLLIVHEIDYASCNDGRLVRVVSKRHLLAVCQNKLQASSLLGKRNHLGFGVYPIHLEAIFL